MVHAKTLSFALTALCFAGRTGGIDGHGHMFSPAPRNVRTDDVGGCVNETCQSACRDNLATCYSTSEHFSESCSQCEGSNPFLGQGNRAEQECQPWNCWRSSCCASRHFENIAATSGLPGLQPLRPDLWEFRGTHSASGHPYTGRTLCIGEENKGSGKLSETAKGRLLDPNNYRPNANCTSGEVVAFEWAPTHSHYGIFGYAIKCSGTDELPADWEEIEFQPLQFVDENGDDLTGGTETHGHVLYNDATHQLFEDTARCQDASLNENNCVGTEITKGCTCKDATQGIRDPPICTDTADRSISGTNTGFWDEVDDSPGCRPHFKSYHRIPKECTGHAVVVHRHIGHNQNSIWQNCADVMVGPGNGQPFPFPS
jgi:hypothetical protein